MQNKIASEKQVLWLLIIMTVISSFFIQAIRLDNAPLVLFFRLFSVGIASFSFLSLFIGLLLYLYGNLSSSGANGKVRAKMMIKWGAILLCVFAFSFVIFMPQDVLIP